VEEIVNVKVQRSPFYFHPRKSERRNIVEKKAILSLLFVENFSINAKTTHTSPKLIFLF
jgi:hypothetical protein